MMYSNGKLVCVCVKSTKAGINAMRRVYRRCLNLDYKVNLDEIQVTNIVATYNTAIVSFEPELFPNAILDMGDKKKINMSKNGKVVFTGIKTELELNLLYKD
ncbi:unnamed protein product, partial [Medioppia subpectinata]